MTQMKVSELGGAELDYWVGRAECVLTERSMALIVNGKPYFPSTDWARGGPIIEREHIWLAQTVSGMWRATMKPHFWDRASEGPTPLIAAMRCFVSREFGDKVLTPTS